MLEGAPKVDYKALKNAYTDLSSDGIYKDEQKVLLEVGFFDKTLHCRYSLYNF